MVWLYKSRNKNLHPSPPLASRTAEHGPLWPRDLGRPGAQVRVPGGRPERGAGVRQRSQGQGRQIQPTRLDCWVFTRILPQISLGVYHSYANLINNLYVTQSLRF